MPQRHSPSLPTPARSDFVLSTASSAQRQCLASLSLDTANPDHHLWRNGRLWWIAFTVHLPGWRKERVRLSLGTADLAEARRRRDRIFEDYPQARGCELSLRIEAPRRRSRESPMREVAA